MIKWWILGEDKTILNVSEPENRVSKYIRQKYIEVKGIKGEIIIVEDLKHLLFRNLYIKQSEMGKKIVDLNKMINQLDLIDIYRLFHPATSEHTFFSGLHGTCNRIVTKEDYSGL